MKTNVTAKTKSERRRWTSNLLIRRAIIILQTRFRPVQDGLQRCNGSALQVKPFRPSAVFFEHRLFLSCRARFHLTADLGGASCNALIASRYHMLCTSHGSLVRKDGERPP